jgi:hypothetical protein
MCRRGGLTVTTKCCTCEKLRSIPAVAKKRFNVRHRCELIRDEKELSRIKNKLKQV